MAPQKDETGGQWYILHKAGKHLSRLGPFTRQQMETACRKRAISPRTPVRQGADDKWEEASTIFDFRTIAPQDQVPRRTAWMWIAAPAMILLVLLFLFLKKEGTTQPQQRSLPIPVVTEPTPAAGTAASSRQTSAATEVSPPTTENSQPPQANSDQAAISCPGPDRQLREKVKKEREELALLLERIDRMNEELQAEKAALPYGPAADEHNRKVDVHRSLVQSLREREEACAAMAQQYNQQLERYKVCLSRIGK